MQVLVLGSGAREHAIIWKIAKAKRCTSLMCWPGNTVSRKLAKPLFEDSELNDYPPSVANGLRKLSADGFSTLTQKIKSEQIDLVVCGPENPLSEGIGDACAQAGINFFGPSQQAAQLEASKAFAKQAMLAAGIPTARFTIASSREQAEQQALDLLARTGGAIIKADGLMSGKGVFICSSESEITNACDILFNQMSQASNKVLIEEKLLGRECSHFALVGNGVVHDLGFAVDFKRLKNGDIGPNTGGMGTYTPVPWLTQQHHEKVREKIIEPLLKELNHRGTPFTGCLFTGIMWHDDEPSVIEYNVRFGDPEAQVLSQSDPSDWLDIFAKCTGITEPESMNDENTPTHLTRETAVCVVMASKGYPYAPEAESIPLPADLFADGQCTNFAAGVTANSENKPVTGTGRVLSIVGRSQKPDPIAALKEARASAYKTVKSVAEIWPNALFRDDIAGTVCGD